MCLTNYDTRYIILPRIPRRVKLEVMTLLRLKKALDARGITQKSCAELLGVSEKTLYNKLTGDSEFTYSEVKRLRAFLPEYNIDYLLAGDQDSA